MAKERVPREMIIEALTEENYESWKESMRNYLMRKGLWVIVNGAEPEPNKRNSSSEAAQFWRKRNAKALHAIQVCCGSKMFSHIIEKESARAAWDCLEFIHHSRYQQLYQHKIAAQMEHDVPLDPEIQEKDIPYLSLYKAVIGGKFDETKNILEEHPKAVRARISADGGTALHNAVLHEHKDLVELLLQKMNVKDLELRTKCQNGATALHIAASGSNVEMAEALVKKNSKLLRIQNSDGYLPVCIAALYGDNNKMMFQYLCSATPDEELNPRTSDNNGATLLSIAISNEDYDFALKLLDRYPKLAITKNNKETICLSVLAQKVSSFPDGNQLSTWKRLIYNRFKVESKKWSDIGEHSGQYLRSRICEKLGIDKIHEMKVKNFKAKKLLERIFDQLYLFNSIESLESVVMPALFQAVEARNVVFINEMLDFYPALLRSGTKSGGIFHKAVAQRQESISAIIHTLPEVIRHDVASMKDEFGNNLLHAAASLRPGLKNSPVPALQMHRELQSFEEVEALLPPILKEKKNNEGKTAQTMFDEEHSCLAREGKKWMEELATSCTLVATLIISVMFSGANQSWGDVAAASAEIEFISGFHIFMIADALSVVFSTLSLLTFLSIFSIGNVQKDFHRQKLPKRFMTSLLALFFSIGTVMVAFGVLFFDKLSSAQKWGALAFSSLAMVPAAVFAVLHLPLLLEMIKYYCHRYFKSLQNFPIYQKLSGQKNTG